MFRPRVMPCLLLHRGGLVKTRRFRQPVYLGDPINTARIFSDKEVDELVVLDIDASREGRPPDYELLAEIAGECFMPFSYGGGVATIEQVRRLIRCGIEKVIITSAALDSTALVTQAAELFGSQAVVGGLEVRRDRDLGWRLSSHSGTRLASRTLDEHIDRLVAAGAGELLINDVDREGTGRGYDLGLIRHVSGRVSVPVVACGGAATIEHLREAVQQGGASAVAAGSMFVFHGRHRAVLVHYPSCDQLSGL